MKLWNHEKNSGGFLNFISLLFGLIEDNWISSALFIWLY